MALLAMPAGCALAQNAPRPAASPYQGITVPRGQRQLLSLKLSDVVWEVNVNPGDKIKVGQVLISEDTREEEINLKIIKLEVDSQAAVKAAEAALDSAKVAVQAAITTRDSKKVEYDRVLKMKDAAQPSEVEKAKLDLALAEIDIEKSQKDVVRAEREIDKAKVETGQKALQADRQAVTIERMKIVSPVNGFVEDILVHKGEVVDPQKPAIVVVDNDTLWAEIYLPTQVAISLQKDQPVTLVYVGEKGQPKVTGKVTYISPVVDAAADQRLVRVEIDNTKDQRPAGLKVELVLADAGAKADGK